MVIDKRLQIKAPVAALKPVEGQRLCVIGSDGTVRYFKLDPVELLDGFKSTFPIDESLYNAADVSHEGKFVAFCVRKGGVAVFSGLHKKLIHRFERHEGDVESVAMGQRRSYLATGGQDGKTFLWSLVTGRMVASLPHHADFVTAIAFSPNDQWVATGGFDRKILVTNISSLSQSYRLRGHGGAITALKFLTGHRLVAADKSGEIVVWDHFAEKVVRRLRKMLDEVVSFAVTPDDRFLFAADRSGVVSLYDLESYEMLSLRYLSYARPIRKIAYTTVGNYLVVGLEDGEVTFNSPLKESAKMEEAIEAGELGTAYELAERNPLLRYSDAYLRLEALWNDAYEEAVKRLEEGKTEEAKKVLEPFYAESTKRLLAQRLIQDYKEFEKFRTAVQMRKYPLAYSLAAQYPSLKQNPLYEKMEREWERLFAKAKKIILQNGGEEKVRELLHPFRGIPGKTALIQTLLNEKEVYKLFMKMVAKQDYKGAIELAKRYPAIRELEEYRKIERIAEAIAQKARAKLAEGEYAEAARLATQLYEFPDMRELAEEIKEEANLYASAMRHFAEKNYAAVYRILEQFPQLEETRIVQNLEEAWRKVVERAERLAAEGDAAGVLRAFKPFLNIETKRPKIVSTLKQAYIEQLESLPEERIDEAVERYVALFGFDDELGSWLRQRGLDGKVRETAPRDAGAVDLETLPERLA